MRIQHNIMSMNAYRNYNNNTSSLSKNLEKLSSGYKINRAGDDAAGLAISEKMRAQITGLTQAQANAKSGINLVQTAEGAMQEVQDMLNRMVKLADQSANGTYDNEVDRANLQEEVDQLKSEINRIADSANFNGIKLLDGSMDAEGIVGGGDLDVKFSNLNAFKASTANANPKFTVDLDGLVMKSTSSAGGSINIQVGSQTVKLNFNKKAGSAVGLGDLTLSTANQTVTLGGVKYGVTYSNSGKLTFTMKTSHVLTASQTLNPAFEVKVGTSTNANITANLINTGTQVITSGKLASAEQQATANFEITKDMLVEGASIKIGNETFTFDFTKSTSTSTVIGVKDLLNDKGELGDDAISQVLTRITDAAKNNDLFTVGNDGKNHITLQSKSNLTTSDTDELDTIEKVKNHIKVTVPEKKGSALTLQIGDTSDSFNRMTVSIQSVKTKDLKIDGVNIGTITGAQTAVDQIKAAINTVSRTRGILGATQNRLDHTINNLSVMAENIQDAEATVRDTDVAEEMMAYTKNNILVQSAQAMLAQANQVPQGVLQLLQ